MFTKYRAMRYKAVAVVGHVLAIVLAVAIFIYALSSCFLMASNSDRLIFVSPFEVDADYTKSEVFCDTFLSDASSLIKYLAVCKQFETNGVFDPNKEVDILEYYFRKNPNAKDISSKGIFSYRVQDLIMWKESYGFTIYDNKMLEEVFMPSDGVSVYAKEEDLVMFMEQYQAIKEYENSGAKLTAEEYENVADEAFLTIEEMKTETVTESSKKLYGADGKVVKQEVYELFNEMLTTVASDLAYNYSIYQEEKDYFVNVNNNFKYLYLPAVDKKSETEFYSNLTIKNRQQAEQMAEYFKQDIWDAYVCVDAASGNIEAKTVDVSATRFLYNLNQMKYAFSGGGKLYLGVLGDENEGFAEYSDEDVYAQMEQIYVGFQSNFRMYFVGILICILVSLLFLIMYTVLCGRNEKGEEVRFLFFDRWYTEIAAAVSAVVIVGMTVLYIILVDVVTSDAGNALVYRLMHEHYLLMFSVAYIGIADLIVLFFYGSFVRRIKARRLWNDSIVGKLIGGLYKLSKFLVKGMKSIYYNANCIVQTVLIFIPVVVLVGIHLLAGIYEDVLVLLLAVILDIAAFLFLLYINMAKNRIIKGVERISGGELDYQVDTSYIYGDNLRLAAAVNHIGDGIREAVNQSMKDERMKADLITNVSHDIKTPLTSIINYVDLLKREQVKDETIRGYIEVLDNKSQRLKQLTEDLVEASKISSGNIVLNIEELNVVDLMKQALGEFTDKFDEKGLTLVTAFSETPCLIEADSRRMWRVIDNLLGNVYKYAMENTRVYIEVKDLSVVGKKASISIKNISKQALNIDANELTERFIRGDISRSTEGSGLGLSIAKSLVEVQNGTFNLYLDGDLFKTTIIF